MVFTLATVSITNEALPFTRRIFAIGSYRYRDDIGFDVVPRHLNCILTGFPHVVLRAHCLILRKGFSGPDGAKDHFAGTQLFVWVGSFWNQVSMLVAHFEAKS